MRKLSIIALLSAVLAGCQSVPRGIKPVWTHAGQPSSETAAPPQFRVTPVEAFRIARESRQLSLKHHWHLYADSKFYYIHDTFLGDGPHRAFKYGLRIDGRTGAIQEAEQD
jgi:hypothetical protein